MRKKIDQIIEPINANMDDVVNSLVNPITKKSVTIKHLPSNTASNPITGQQLIRVIRNE